MRFLWVLSPASATTGHPPAIRAGVGAAAAGGVLWIVSEIVERLGGWISDPSMGLLILGCL